MTSGIDMQYPVDGDDYTYRPIEYVTLRRADLHALHGDMAALESALEAVQADDAALRQRLAEVETQLAAVPVEAIYYVWLAAVAHSCDNGNYASKDVIAVDIWLAAQHVKPWEVQPCPKCKGTGYRYNIYGEMAECMDCGARGEAQP